MSRRPGLGTLWRTLRHLRFRQIAYQVARRLLPPARPAPLPLRWRAVAPRTPPPLPGVSARFDGVATFRFNNTERTFAGWNDSAARKLWLYNLHYMEWLFDIADVEEREAWIRRWIRENPRASEGNGWEPYPLSLRLFSWLRHYLVSGRTPEGLVLASMGEQTATLFARLEYHLDANHLLENLLALAFAASFLEPSDPRASKVRCRVGRLLKAELEAQFLQDGGHYERSPMYHAILLERLLDLLNFVPAGAEVFPRKALEGLARRGMEWLDVMSAAGRFSLFNDSCYGVAKDTGALDAYAATLFSHRPPPTTPLRELAPSGYYRAETGDGEEAFLVLFDAGELAPDHQMGHAQGDLLSFCLWMGNVPVITHPGNYEYVGGGMRDYCRSTAAHNTLSIDGAELAEWWGSHRVGRRARPLNVSARREDARVMLRGAHDGYLHLPGAPMHERTLELSPEGLEITDVLSVDPGRVARVWYHFHPECELRLEGPCLLEIRAGGRRLYLETDLPMRLEASWHCPEFGLRIASRAAMVEGRTRFHATLRRVEIGNG